MEEKVYTFTSRVEVLVPSGSGGRRAWTTAGIICLLIALVCELLINNTYALVLAVPLLYLLRLRRQMGGMRRPMDIRTGLALFDGRVEITYHDCLFTRRGTLTKRYVISRDGVRRAERRREQDVLDLVFDGDIQIFGPDGKPLQSRRVRNEHLTLRLPPEACGSVCSLLER